MSMRFLLQFLDKNYFLRLSILGAMSFFFLACSADGIINLDFVDRDEVLRLYSINREESGGQGVTFSALFSSCRERRSSPEDDESELGPLFSLCAGRSTVRLTDNSEVRWKGGSEASQIMREITVDNRTHYFHFLGSEEDIPDSVTFEWTKDKDNTLKTEIPHQGLFKTPLTLTVERSERFDSADNLKDQTVFKIKINAPRVDKTTNEKIESSWQSVNIHLNQVANEEGTKSNPISLFQTGNSNTDYDENEKKRFIVFEDDAFIINIINEELREYSHKIDWNKALDIQVRFRQAVEMERKSGETNPPPIIESYYGFDPKRVGASASE